MQLRKICTFSIRLNQMHMIKTENQKLKMRIYVLQTCTYVGNPLTIYYYERDKIQHKTSSRRIEMQVNPKWKYKYSP